MQHYPYVVLEVEEQSGAIATCRVCPSKVIALQVATFLVSRPDHPAGNTGKDYLPGSLSRFREDLRQHETATFDGYRYHTIPAAPFPSFEPGRKPERSPGQPPAAPVVSRGILIDIIVAASAVAVAVALALYVQFHIAR